MGVSYKRLWKLLIDRDMTKGELSTFDFSSVLKHLVISPVKDENEHFDPTEVRNLLLRELR